MLNAGQKLMLHEINQKVGRAVQIENAVRYNDKSSFNVYTAVSKRKHGFLYELYDDFLLERTETGRLRLTDKSLKEDFAEFRGGVAQNIEALKKSELDIFSEMTVLYSGAVTHENINKKDGSLYVWVPCENQTDATAYFTEGVDKKSIVFPENRMYGAICIASFLSEVMSKVNGAGFRFDALSLSDITFRYGKRFDINKETVRLNCLDSLVLSEPRFAFENDIDLFGRLLFYMVTGSEYKSDCYGELYDRISYSPLVQSSYRNSSIYVVNYLYEIIRKSVSGEYTSYVQVMTDLHNLENSFLFEKTTRKVGAIRPLDSVRADRESKLVSTAAIQNMLDSRPLYSSLPDKIEKMHVLSVGCGNYGQEFINQVLQVGQMLDVDLKITAVSDNPEADKNSYLTNKNALRDYVSINGSNVEKPYAKLNFEPVSDDDASFSLINREDNQKLVLDIIERFDDVCYIFVALGNDKLNKDIADMFADLTESFDYRCCVNYACNRNSAESGKAYPVFINGAKSKKINNTLYDMALKVHLSWSKIADKDINTIRQSFENDPYSYNSSIANAVSIRYKLRCFGIEYDYNNRESLVQAAKKFSSLVLENDDRTNFNTLAWLEHRRWNLEKAVNGWSTLHMKDYKKVISKLSLKNEEKKRHHCMVRSLLSESGNIWEAKNLNDPLDKVSVAMNDALKVAAELNKENWPEQEDALAHIGSRIKKVAGEKMLKSRAQYAYNRYIVAIKNILGNSTDYAKRYASYRKNLLNACESVGGEVFKDEISYLLKPVDAALFPMVECAKKTDYKKIDSFLIFRIPYILTAPLAPSIAMGFSPRQGNEETLNNIAAALALSADNVYYYFYYDSDSNYNYLARKIKIILNYLKEKNIYCKTDFFIAVDPQVARLSGDINQKLSSVKGINCTVMNCRDEEDAHQKFKAHLSDKKIDFFNRSVNVYKDVYLNDHLYRTLGYPGFAFSLEKNRFRGDERCGFVSYVDASDMNLTTEDLLLLANAKDSSFHFPELFDSAESMWKEVCDYHTKNMPYSFSNNIYGWNDFCRTVSRHMYTNDALGIIKLKKEKKGKDSDDVLPRIEGRFSLPSMCFASAKKITDSLVEEGVVSGENCIKLRNKTSGTCEISVTAGKNVIEVLEKVFNMSPDILSNSKLIEAGIVRDANDDDDEQVKERSFVISFNSLSVKNLAVHKDDENNARALIGGTVFLKRLEKKGFIKNFRIESDAGNGSESVCVSFDFASYGVKDVLKKEGELLENFIFCEAAKTGYFDDVAGGFEFTYESELTDEPVKNEVDCLLTKNNKTIVVEAKQRVSIGQDTIHKLCNVANNIGVNAKKVLVITDHGKNGNQLQFARGDKDEIIIVSGRDEINRIGEILKEIAQGTYIAKERI